MPILLRNKDEQKIFNLSKKKKKKVENVIKMLKNHIGGDDISTKNLEQ